MPPDRAFNTAPSTFFGNPDQSYSKQDVHIANAVIEHDFNNGLTVKNSSRFANYDKFYQNVFPTTALREPRRGLGQSRPTTTELSARICSTRPTGPTRPIPARAPHHRVRYRVRQRQSTFSLPQHRPFQRQHGTTLSGSRVQPDAPLIRWRSHNNASTDDNNTYANLNLARSMFRTRSRSAATCSSSAAFATTTSTCRHRTSIRAAPDSRTDDLVSPRAGVIIKPVDNVSVYGSYSVSYLPSAGDQFSTLTPGLVVAVPEKFMNNEVGREVGYLSAPAIRNRCLRSRPDQSASAGPEQCGRSSQAAPPTPAASKPQPGRLCHRCSGRSRAAMPIRTPDRRCRTRHDRAARQPRWPRATQYLLAVEQVSVHPACGPRPSV
jgi:catecholate siderophore receptor